MVRHRVDPFLLFAVLATLWALGLHGVPARAQAGQGVLLVATASIAGSMFDKSVVLVTRTPAGETVGVIVNRALDVPPPADLAALPGVGPRLHRVHRGGPLAPAAYFAIAETAATPAGTLAAADGVRFAAGQGSIKALFDSVGNGRVKLFLGYAGWAPGQLESEIARGHWQALDVDPEVLFDAAPDSLWERLSARRRAVRARPEDYRPGLARMYCWRSIERTSISRTSPPCSTFRRIAVPGPPEDHSLL